MFCIIWCIIGFILFVSVLSKDENITVGLLFGSLIMSPIGIIIFALGLLLWFLESDKIIWKRKK